ncbi:hypothetical protein PLICRDRAFT_121618 [Plicaturopsis crispa FD-325 SS-3]|nr:hypothetical protein PLICRDRAFT_121618 [Plicaturopsis crispa FD-325 SS-3]
MPTWIPGGSSRITFRNHVDMDRSLESARKYVVEFKKGSVEAIYRNTPYEFKFEYRDPWDWILSIVTDETLASESMWYSVRKYYCENGVEDRLFDEPNTGEAWWEVDDALPDDEDYPHCFLPLHLWLDKANITKRVKKHPIVLRAVWLPRRIRNASGNGGGILIGYMPIVADPANPSDRNASETLEFANFKRDVYQKVLNVVFERLRRRSHHGETVRCGDKIPRILHPGIHIESLDGEEASTFCCVRAALANHPCPKCLVHKSKLHELTTTFEPRTTESMRAVFRRAALAGSKAKTENILKDHGLNNVEHFLWKFRFSDPYAAYCYDTLHSDDIGKWGKHLWPLVLGVLTERGCLGRLAKNFKAIPRLSNLKSFDNVTTIEYTDGQGYLDILKGILPCIVQLLPKNSPLVHCIRAYARYRMMVGMHCMSESRLKRLEGYLAAYEHWCTMLGDLKDFDFFKQHASSHAPRDIRARGSTDNFSTRPGEGVQQEVREAYEETNGKNAESQMTRRDANHEAIARIRMAVDDDNRARLDDAELDDDVEADTPAPPGSDSIRHWKLGSPESRRTDSMSLEASKLKAASPEFSSFHTKLSSFLALHVPQYPSGHHGSITIREYKCVYIHYQSLEDWTAARDILRCSADFHGRSRRDCFIVNMDSPRLTCARLLGMYRCTLPSGDFQDVAFVRMFRPNSWRPNTLWDGCYVSDEEAEPTFVMMQYMVRGAHMIPAFDSPSDRRFYLDDLADPDMFLRAGN